MIRFVRVGDQVNENADEFAFFNTVTDRFVEVSGAHLWASLDDLIEDLAADKAVTEELGQRLIESASIGLDDDVVVAPGTVLFRVRREPLGAADVDHLVGMLDRKVRDTEESALEGLDSDIRISREDAKALLVLLRGSK